MLRVFHHYFSSRKLALFLIESAAIASAGLVGEVLVARAFAPARHPPALDLPSLSLLALGFLASFQFALYLFDLYDLRVALEDRLRGGRVLRAAAVCFVGVSVFLLVAQVRLPEGSIFGAALGALLGVWLVRGGLGVLLGEPAPVLILGDGARGRTVAQAIAEEGLKAVLLALSERAPGKEPLAERVRRIGARYVVVAPEEMRGTVESQELVRCRFFGARVYEADGFCERVLRRIPVAFLRASALAYSDELTVSATRRLFKRTFDVLVAAAVLVIAAPLMVLIALLIKLDSAGPVFYRQERVGLGGQRYRLWKFRSMRPDAERNGAVWARDHDERVTRVGRVIRKTRMDELPQLFNVLVGQMSFVGPRPERPVFVEKLRQEIPFYPLREGVKPGITGWAQIRYPYGASVEDARNKLEFDLYYLKNGSLFLDLAIIFHTVRHVLLGRGAR